MTPKSLLLTLTFTFKSTTVENKKRLYDKRDDFPFPVINYLPFISSNIPASPTYEVYISQLIRYYRTCAQYSDCLDRDQLLTQKLLKRGYDVARLKLFLQTFYGRHHNLIDHYEISISQMTMDFFTFYVDFCFPYHWQDFDRLDCIHG